MKKMLKLDNLSSKELEKKQLNKVKGGMPPCGCRCYCVVSTARFSELRGVLYDMYMPI